MVAVGPPTPSRNRQVKFAPLPERQMGRHQWLLSSYHVLTDGQASAFKHGAVIRLDESNRVDTTDMVCRWCHARYPGLHVCPGEPPKDAAKLVLAGRV